MMTREEIESDLELLRQYLGPDATVIITRLVGTLMQACAIHAQALTVLMEERDEG